MWPPTKSILNFYLFQNPKHKVLLKTLPNRPLNFHMLSELWKFLLTCCVQPPPHQCCIIAATTSSSIMALAPLPILNWDNTSGNIATSLIPHHNHHHQQCHYDHHTFLVITSTLHNSNSLKFKTSIKLLLSFLFFFQFKYEISYMVQRLWNKSKQVIPFQYYKQKKKKMECKIPDLALELVSPVCGFLTEIFHEINWHINMSCWL